MEVSEGREGLRNAGLAIIAVGVILAGLVYGRAFLIPLAISILVWNLLEAMIERFASLRLGSFQVPKWLAALLGITVVLLGLYLVIWILLSQVDAVTAAWPRYVARLQASLKKLSGARVGPVLAPRIWSVIGGLFL
jgi:predicted PurR-regulated permease PerM